MSFAEEVVSILQTAGVATPNQTLFISTKRSIPSDIDWCIIIKESGGMAPTRIQNQFGVAYTFPTAQILTIGKRYEVVRAKAKDAYVACANVHDQTVSGTHILWLRPRQEPFDLGLDAENRAQVVFNVAAHKALS